jgi:lipopolysaccharide export system permease protein
VKKIDRLVIGELLGPWVFGVAIFTVLISAGQFLFQITAYLASGADVWSTIKLLGYFMPGVIAKTLSMSMLLSTLLAFGRLSGDSEIVAMRAGGISLSRIMVPVGVFGLAVSVMAFVFSDMIVPTATKKALEIKLELEEQKKERSEQSTSRPIYKDGRLQMILVARDFDIATGVLRGVTLVMYDKNGVESAIFWAPRMSYENEQKWLAPEGGRFLDLRTKAEAESPGPVLPTEVPNPDVTPADLLTQALKELDALSMNQMQEQIERERARPDYSLKQVANLEYGYWNKLALPLAALVFGLVGAPLGIRSHRAGTATGFALSVVIIFCYMMLANAMSIMAQGGRIPAYVASFTPIVIGLVVAVVLIHRRNR